MSKQDGFKKKDPTPKITYQKYSYGFKKTILAEIENGQRKELEKIHVFWIDLKNPMHNGKLY